MTTPDPLKPAIEAGRRARPWVARSVVEDIVRAAAPIIAAQANENMIKNAEILADELIHASARLAEVERERDEAEEKRLATVEALKIALTSAADLRARLAAAEDALATEDGFWGELRAELGVPEDWEPLIEPEVRRIAAWVDHQRNELATRLDRAESDLLDHSADFRAALATAGRDARQAVTDKIIAHADRFAPADGNYDQLRLRRHLMIAARLADPTTDEEIHTAAVRMLTEVAERAEAVSSDADPA